MLLCAAPTLLLLLLLLLFTDKRIHVCRRITSRHSAVRSTSSLDY